VKAEKAHQCCSVAAMPQQLIEDNKLQFGRGEWPGRCVTYLR
jgi:hypothetical protein